MAVYDPDPVDHSSLFVLSQDTLRGTKVDQIVSDGWPDRPPLPFGGGGGGSGGGGRRGDGRDLKEMCRRGVPPPLRCAVWVTSVVRLSHPHLPRIESEEYGTLGRVRALDAAWSDALRRTFPEPSDEDEAPIPDFGPRGEQVRALAGTDHGGPIPAGGVRSLKRVLCAVRHMHSVVYAPLLPDLTAVLLNYMPESHAYATLREMTTDSSSYFPSTKVEHYAVCRTFGDVMRGLHPKTAAEMEENGALSPRGLDPIFRRFFTTLLEYEHVVRIMDVYALEGYKVIFRFGVALIAMWKTHLKTMRIKDASAWWDRIREYARSPPFDFDELVRRSYSPAGSGLRRRINFPRRRVISRLVRCNEEWAAGHVSVRRGGAATGGPGGTDDDDDDGDGAPPRPLGLANGGAGAAAASAAALARPSKVRTSLAGWLPPPYRTATLELLYSADEHGRSLRALYGGCARTKHTIALLEVLDTGATIGMYATHAWRPQPDVYGDGECFLFRARPDPEAFKWRPLPPSASFDDSESEALVERFQVSRDDFLSMGANRDGTCGLRLNGALTRGESAPAVGFDNEPLAGPDLREFDVGAVEVYRLLREVDGKPVDGEDDMVWNLDGL